MATATELLVEEEYGDLAQVAEDHGWKLSRLAPLWFVLGVPAKGARWLYVRCEAEGYPTRPPAWRWSDERGDEVDTPRVTAFGGAFFHGNGVICAPWNLLAYKSEDARGPHEDWVIGNWVENRYTRQCMTLAAMAARIAIEAAVRFERMAA